MASPPQDVEKNDSYSTRTPSEERTDDESTREKRAFEVVLEPEDDPKFLPVWRKWLTAIFINMGAICVTGASSMVRTPLLPQRDSRALRAMFCIDRLRPSKSPFRKDGTSRQKSPPFQ